MRLADNQSSWVFGTRPSSWRKVNIENVPRVISTEFHKRNHDKSVNFSLMPTPIRMIAHIIMKTVIEQTATSTSFLRSGSMDFQTTWLGTVKTKVVSESLIEYRDSSQLLLSSFKTMIHPKGMTGQMNLTQKICEDVQTG